MKKINIFYKNLDRPSESSESTKQKETGQKKDIFSNPEEQFSKLKNKEKISKEFYLKQLKEFENKTGEQGKQILNHLQSFLQKNNIDDVKGQLATAMFVEKLIEKKGQKTEKVVKLLEKKKPALLIKMINGFNDNVINESKDFQEVKQTKQKVNLLKKEKLEAQGVDNVDKKLNNNIKIISDTLISKYHFSEKKANEFAKNAMNGIKKDENILKVIDDIEKIMFSDLANNINSELEKTNPQLNAQIKEKSAELRKKHPEIGENQAYLLYVAHERKTNPDFPKINLGAEEKSILANVEQKWGSLLVEEKAFDGEKVSSEIKDFANSETSFDGKIKESLDISGLDNINISLDQQKQLSGKYPKLINKMFQQVVLKNKGIDEKQLEADYSKYLNGKKTKEDKIFSVVGKKLLEYEIKQSTEGFVQEYKQFAMKEYTKSIFNMFNKAVGTENITKNFGKTDKFEIKKSGQVDLNFKYKNTPLDFKITAEGDIKITNYVARDGVDKNSGAFQKKETKLNDFFTIVSIKNLLQPEKINLQDLIQKKDIKQALSEQIQGQIKNKLEKNNALGNQELMKTETKYEMERQSITYKMLSLYQPPQKVKNYLTGNNEKISEQDRGLFYFLGRIDKTLRMNEQAQNVLEATLADEKFTSIFKNLRNNENTKTGKENTYDIFSKFGFLGINGELNLRKIKKLKIQVDKVSSENDCKHLPEIEGYTWKYENGKVKLKEKKEESDLFASLDQKFPNTKKIEI